MVIEDNTMLRETVIVKAVEARVKLNRGSRVGRGVVVLPGAARNIQRIKKKSKNEKRSSVGKRILLK